MDPSFKVYIYCTLSGEAWLTKGEQPVQGNGKVIGEFICSKIDELKSNEVFNAHEMYNQAHHKFYIKQAPQSWRYVTEYWWI